MGWVAGCPAGGWPGRGFVSPAGSGKLPMSGIASVRSADSGFSGSEEGWRQRIAGGRTALVRTGAAVAAVASRGSFQHSGFPLASPGRLGPWGRGDMPEAGVGRGFLPSTVLVAGRISWSPERCGVPITASGPFGERPGPAGEAHQGREQEYRNKHRQVGADPSWITLGVPTRPGGWDHRQPQTQLSDPADPIPSTTNAVAAP